MTRTCCRKALLAASGGLYVTHRAVHHQLIGGAADWGAGLATGTRGAYWSEQALPSVLKHSLLGRYIPQSCVRLRRCCGNGTNAGIWDSGCDARTAAVPRTLLLV